MRHLRHPDIGTWPGGDGRDRNPARWRLRSYMWGASDVWAAALGGGGNGSIQTLAPRRVLDCALAPGCALSFWTHSYCVPVRAGGSTSILPVAQTQRVPQFQYFLRPSASVRTRFFPFRAARTVGSAFHGGASPFCPKGEARQPMMRCSSGGPLSDFSL